MDISSEMMVLATNSFKQIAEFRRSRDKEVAKLWEELHQEKASREEACRILKGERRVHEVGLLPKKAIFDAALEEDKGLRVAVETRIEALEANLNEVRAKIRTAVADFKKSPVFESIVESKRQ